MYSYTVKFAHNVKLVEEMPSLLLQQPAMAGCMITSHTGNVYEVMEIGHRVGADGVEHVHTTLYVKIME